MKIGRFDVSILFHRQYSIEWHTRKIFVNRCIEQLERGEAMITHCDDRHESYADYDGCRVYFYGDILLRYEITLGPCR